MIAMLILSHGPPAGILQPNCWSLSSNYAPGFAFHGYYRYLTLGVLGLCSICISTRPAVSTNGWRTVEDRVRPYCSCWTSIAWPYAFSLVRC
jgi:hypothetical protein